MYSIEGKTSTFLPEELQNFSPHYATDMFIFLHIKIHANENKMRTKDLMFHFLPPAGKLAAPRDSIS